MPKYRIDQTVEHISKDPWRYRWTVSVHIEDKVNSTIDATGTTNTEGKATDYAAQFLRWAIKTHDLFGLQSNGCGLDDDDDENPF
jgi:hypothetical protein